MCISQGEYSFGIMVSTAMDRIAVFGVVPARQGRITWPLRVAISERIVVALVLPVMKGVSVFVVAIIV